MLSLNIYGHDNVEYKSYFLQLFAEIAKTNSVTAMASRAMIRPNGCRHSNI